MLWFKINRHDIVSIQNLRVSTFHPPSDFYHLARCNSITQSEQNDPVRKYWVELLMIILSFSLLFRSKTHLPKVVSFVQVWVQLHRVLNGDGGGRSSWVFAFCTFCVYHQACFFVCFFHWSPPHTGIRPLVNGCFQVGQVIPENQLLSKLCGKAEGMCKILRFYFSSVFISWCSSYNSELMLLRFISKLNYMPCWKTVNDF